MTNTTQPKGCFDIHIESGAKHTVKFGSTTAQILKQGGIAADYNGRLFSKDVEAWWA
jgi:hypothetical protein